VPSTGSSNDEFEVRPQKGCGFSKDRELRRPGTYPGIRPGTRYGDSASYSLAERGVKPGDGRMLSSIVNKATSSESIEWNLFMEDEIVSLPR